MHFPIAVQLCGKTIRSKRKHYEAITRRHTVQDGCTRQGLNERQVHNSLDLAFSVTTLSQDNLLISILNKWKSIIAATNQEKTKPLCW